MPAFIIKQIHILILKAIKNREKQVEIAADLNLTQSAISQRLLILEREGYIKRGIKTVQQNWELTAKGDAVLEGVSATFSSHQKKSDIVHSNLKSSQADNPQPKAISLQKRANGFRLYFYLFPTEYGKLEAKLAEAGIIAKLHRIRNSKQYMCNWKGFAITLTTRKLIINSPDALYQFQINGKLITNMEIEKASLMLHEFIKATKIRLVESQGKYKCRLAHLEIAYVKEGIARELTSKRKGLIPLAFDENSLKVINWADRSLNLWELEFSSLKLEGRTADMMQDMAGDKWNHREEQRKVSLLIDLGLKYDRIISRNELEVEALKQALNELERRLGEQPRQPSRRQWT